MKMTYFKDTDTLDNGFKESASVETKDLDKPILPNLDSSGNFISITLEHTRQRADVYCLAQTRMAA